MTSVMTKVLRGMSAVKRFCSTTSDHRWHVLNSIYDAADAAGPAVQRFSEVAIMASAG